MLVEFDESLCYFHTYIYFPYHVIIAKLDKNNTLVGSRTEFRLQLWKFAHGIPTRTEFQMDDIHLCECNKTSHACFCVVSEFRACILLLNRSTM